MVVRVDVSAIEVQVVGVVGVVRRRRPIETVDTCIVKRTLVVVAACSRKEQRNTIDIAGDEPTTIITSKSGSTVLPDRFGV